MRYKTASDRQAVEGFSVEELAELGLCKSAKDLREDSVQAITKSAICAADVDTAAADADTDPSDAQKESGNYKKGHIRMHGMDVTIENAKGSTRSGKDKDGKTWSTKMKAHYGYIKRTESEADGDHLDVFIGPNPESELVTIISQNDPGGKFDEHKAILGCFSRKAAEELYLSNYETGWKGLGSSCLCTIPQFKWWIEHGDTSKAIKEDYLAEKKSEVLYCTVCKEPWSRCLGRHGSKPCACGSGKPRNKCDCPGGTPDDEHEACDRFHRELKHALGQDKKADYGDVHHGSGGALMPGNETSGDLEKSRPRSRVLGVQPVEQQEDSTCGPAAARAVEKEEIGHATSEPELAEEAHTTDKGGTLPEDLVAAVSKDGLVSRLCEPMSIEQLQTYATQGLPVICAIQSGNNEAGIKKLNEGHYVVVTGYQDDDVVYVDPAEGEEKTMDATEFLSRWQDKDKNGRVRTQLGIVMHATSEDKTASVLGDAAMVQLRRPTWEPSLGVMNNLLNNLRQVHSRGREMVANRQAVQNMQFAQNPRLASQWLQDVFGGRRSPYVTTNFWDRTLLER